MGQRSQIYVIWDNTDTGNKEIVAQYFQWNYGEYMVSRAKQLIDYIAYNCKQKYDFVFNSVKFKEELKIMCQANFDIRSVVLSCDIIEEFKGFSSSCSFSDYIFKNQDNNDGKLFIFIDTKNYKIKYAFTDRNITKTFDAEKYMKWEEIDRDKFDDYELFQYNNKTIKNNATLMSIDELNEIINSEYKVAEEPKSIDYKRLSRDILIKLRSKYSEEETLEILKDFCGLDEKQIKNFVTIS